MPWKLKDDIPQNPTSVTDLIEGDLEEVTGLHLSGKNLKRLPDDLGRLPNLRDLSIFLNQLQSLPDSIGELQHLRILDVDHNPGLRFLPSGLSQLHRLKSLYFRDTAIEHLPPGMEALGIESLSLSRWIADLPRWPVKTLTLWGMSDTDVVQATRHFPAITSLILRGNGLSAFLGSQTPADLLELQLYDHPLSSFPNLTIFRHLTMLRLWKCGLTTLPAWIGGWSQLKTLDLSDNEIATLPRQLADLGDDLELDLDGNPLTPPLGALAKQGTPALFAYLRSLPDDSEGEDVPENTIPEQRAAPLQVSVEDGRLVVPPQAGTAEAARREFLSMHAMVQKRAMQATEAIGGNHAKLVTLLREYLDFLGDSADQLQGIPLGFAGQALGIQTERSRDEDGSDLLSQDQRGALEILLAAHDLLMRSVPEWQDYVLKTGQRPMLSDEIAMLVQTLSRGIAVDLRRNPKEIDRQIPNRLEELADLSPLSEDQRHLSRWGMVDSLGNVLSALGREIVAAAKEIPNEARKKTALGVLCLGAYAGSVFLGHVPELLALAQSLPGYSWLSQIIALLKR